MEYEGIAMPIFSDRITLRSMLKGYAVIDFKGNVIVPFGKYDYIDGFDRGCARVKKGRIANGARDNDCRWGIIDENGNVILAPEYSNIWNFYDKAREFTRVEKGAEQFEFHFNDKQLHKAGHSRYLQEKIKKEMEDYRSLQNYRNETYDDYNGSYAQDVMGYSDQTIDDAFDGDPDAYWNID